MDSNNKDVDFESLDTDWDSGDMEFDPTESEDFYNNLEAAIGAEEGMSELLLEEEPFGSVTDVSQHRGTYSDAEDDIFVGVDAALAEQIEREFGTGEIGSTTEKQPGKFGNTWKTIPNWTKILVSVILVVLLSVGLLFGTSGGRSIIYEVVVDIFMDHLRKENPDDITPFPDETITITTAPGTVSTTPAPGNPDATPEPTTTPIPEQKLMDDERIINVLLLGEENMKGAVRGRTDAMILVSVNLDGGPLKMVSFQRDLFVAIPGKPDDRLNATYAYGGAKLVVETIEKNFGVDIDSYVKVGFDGFENIIDKLGGLRISLTAKESEYLNKTKYISKPEERNTIAGYQTMTGAQVLGYCRVRFVPTADGLANDIGRNQRHRIVLKAIFDQFKSKSLGELLTIMGQCFDYVIVDANLEQIAAECLQAVIEQKMFEIKQLQMPKGGENKNTKINGQDVVYFTPEDVDALKEFLYGDE